MSYFFKRLLIAIPTLMGISLVIFTILALAPGDPLGEFASNPNITEEVRENIRKSFGLDQPIYVRYFKWIFSFLQGNLGYSFTSRSPVLELILQRLPNTLWIVGSAYFLSLIFAFFGGLFSAIKRHSFIDILLTNIAFLGYSLPTFLTGLLLIIIFSVNLNWFDFIYDSNLKIVDLTTFWQQIKQSIMPIFVLAFYQTAILMRFIRSSIIEEFKQDYVRTAYAKGLSKSGVINNHILRNAMIPVVTLIALDIPGIFTGAIVTEQIFRVPGIGALLIESVTKNDTPVVMGITIIYAILIIIFNLIADLSYSYLDPRIKYNN